VGEKDGIDPMLTFANGGYKEMKRGSKTYRAGSCVTGWLRHLDSAFKNQAGRCSVDEQAPFAVGDASVRGTDPAASVDHRSFGLDQTCLRRNRPDE